MIAVASVSHPAHAIRARAWDVLKAIISNAAPQAALLEHLARTAHPSIAAEAVVAAKDGALCGRMGTDEAVEVAAAAAAASFDVKVALSVASLVRVVGGRLQHTLRPDAEEAIRRLRALMVGPVAAPADAATLADVAAMEIEAAVGLLDKMMTGVYK